MHPLPFHDLAEPIRNSFKRQGKPRPEGLCVLGYLRNFGFGRVDLFSLLLSRSAWYPENSSAKNYVDTRSLGPL